MTPDQLEQCARRVAAGQTRGDALTALRAVAAERVREVLARDISTQALPNWAADLAHASARLALLIDAQIDCI